MHADPIVQQLHAHLRREDEAQRAWEHKHNELFSELACAICDDPEALVSVPGYKTMGQRDQPWAAFKVVDDILCGKPELWVQMLRIVGRASKSPDALTRLEAQAWISKVAGKHADYHVDDAMGDD